MARAVQAPTRRALQNASRGADAVRELLQRSLLRTRFFLALRVGFGRGNRGGACWIEFGYPRIHVGSLYDAHARCRVGPLKAIDVPREHQSLESMTGGRFHGATGDCRPRLAAHCRRQSMNICLSAPTRLTKKRLIA